MSSSYNSLIPFTKAKLDEVAETIGITQFPTETGWYQVLGGLIVQGGYVDILSTATATIDLHAPYEKQVLGIWTQVVGGAENGSYITTVALDSFDLVNGSGNRGYYWLSLGV